MFQTCTPEIRSAWLELVQVSHANDLAQEQKLVMISVWWSNVLDLAEVGGSCFAGRIFDLEKLYRESWIMFGGDRPRH
jgi:hypothetical protein